ncbi:hypothetical protein D9M69_603260 [compost metagenome]
MAEPVHGVETEIQNHDYDEQLAPHWQIRWEGTRSVRHPIAQPSQDRGGELDDRQIYDHVKQVGQCVLVAGKPALPEWLQALQDGDRNNSDYGNEGCAGPIWQAFVKQPDHPTRRTTKNNWIAEPANHEPEAIGHRAAPLDDHNVKLLLRCWLERKS